MVCDLPRSGVALAGAWPIVKRHVQGSLMPDVAPDKPVGPIPPSVIAGDNCDLLAAIGPLYCLGAGVDVTYGEGMWWKKYRPDQLVCHDLDLDKGDGVDFTALPEADDTYDFSCFDPPYIPQGGYSTSTQQDFTHRYGLRSIPRDAMWQLIGAGLAECARVTRAGGLVLVKCMDFTNSNRFWLGHRVVLDAGDELGLTCQDLIIHIGGSGPGGHNIFDVIRARRHHSYLLVLRVR